MAVFRRTQTKLGAIEENEYSKVHTLKRFLRYSYDLKSLAIDFKEQKKVLFTQILENANRLSEI